MFTATRDSVIRDAIAAGDITTDPETGSVQYRGREAQANPNGYLYVRIGRYNVTAHRVMWMAQHGTLIPTMQVNHRNGCHWDNRLSNLELVTPSGNRRHGLGQDYTAVGLSEDSNVVDPDWLSRAIAVANDPEASPADIEALRNHIERPASPYSRETFCKQGKRARI